MKGRYKGKTDFPYLTEGAVYEVLGIEKGPGDSDWIRIMTDLEEDYLFLPDDFEILLDEEKTEPVR